MIEFFTLLRLRINIWGEMRQHEPSETAVLLPTMELQALLQKLTNLKRQGMHQPCTYAGFEELVLTCGNAMPVKSSPVTIQHGLPRQCYANCQKIANKNREMLYCEGFALRAGLPIPFAHAWIWHLTEHTILEPTWEEPGTAYWGIAFQTEWLVSFLKARRRHDIISIFEGNHLENYSLLREGLPAEAYHPFPRIAGQDGQA